MADEPERIVLGDTALTAIERTPGSRWSGRKKERQRPLANCENCGAQLTGHYCGQCGQAAVDYRRSFRHVVADVLESFLNWDSKFFSTIALLILKPWRLTNEFLAGKRVRYVNPLWLYLLASILFFFAVNYGAKGLRFEPGKLSPKDRAELEADLKKEDLPPAALENWRPSSGTLHRRMPRRLLTTCLRLHPRPRTINRSRKIGKKASEVS